MDYSFESILIVLACIVIPAIGGLLVVLFVKVIPRDHVAFIEPAYGELKMVQGTVFRWRDYKKIKWTQYRKTGVEIEKSITSLPLKSKIELPAISLLTPDGHSIQAYARFALKVTRPLDAVACVDDIPRELYTRIKYQLENLYSYKTMEEIFEYINSYTTVTMDAYSKEFNQLVSKWGLEISQPRLKLKILGKEIFPRYESRFEKYREGVEKVHRMLVEFEKSETVTEKEMELARTIEKLTRHMVDSCSAKIAEDEDEYEDN